MTGGNKLNKIGKGKDNSIYLKTGQVQGDKKSIPFGNPNSSMYKFQIDRCKPHYQPLKRRKRTGELLNLLAQLNLLVPVLREGESD